VKIWHEQDMEKKMEVNKVESLAVWVEIEHLIADIQKEKSRKIIMRSIIKSKEASAVPVILFMVTIIVCGALYTLFFLEIGFPLFKGYIPASDSKTFIMMMLYAIPLIVLLVGVISLLKAGIKRTIGGNI